MNDNKRSIILEGKNLDDLIQEGLRELNRSKEEVNIEVIEEGKSLMGVSLKKYKIQISVKESIHKDIPSLKEIESVIKNNRNYEVSFQEDGVYLKILGNNVDKKSILNDVLNYIDRKEIVDYDLDIVNKAISSMEHEYVKFAPFQEEKNIDADLIVEISSDKMKGFVTLIPPYGGKDIDIDQAVKKLEEVIKFGLTIEEVKKIIEKKTYNKQTLIASGRNPIDGEDGYITYNFNTEDNFNPEILNDGSVNYRNLGIINNVKTDEIIAKIHLPNDGEPGMTVTGDFIQQRKGRNAILKYGKNVKLSEDGLELISTCDGQVYLDDGKIIVNEIYEVPNNVDNSTGNIFFNGIVKVKGNVLTGFEIKADGSIEIDGVVEGARLESKGDIILKRGIQGYNKGELISSGNIFAKYVENSYLTAQGDIEAEAVMHSQVISNNIIKVEGKKGLIVGGICKATREIHAKIIGSTMATTTILEVGVDPNLKTRYEGIKNEIYKIEDNLDKLNKTISLLSRLAKNDNLTSEKKKLLIKSLQTKKLLDNKHLQLKDELLDIETNMEMISKGKIYVENVIYPGTKITIGNSVMFIREEHKHCSFYKEQGEIRIGPYK